MRVSTICVATLILLSGCTNPPPQKTTEKALVKLQKNKIQLLEKIRFEFGKPNILPASHPILDQLADLLQDTPSIKKVEIQAHIDARGSSDFNLKLTQQRAESVLRDLTEKGVSPKRMIAKGYGDTRPIYCEPHGCPEKCRRIEVWIIKGFQVEKGATTQQRGQDRY